MVTRLLPEYPPLSLDWRVGRITLRRLGIRSIACRHVRPSLLCISGRSASIWRGQRVKLGIFFFVLALTRIQYILWQLGTDPPEDRAVDDFFSGSPLPCPAVLFLFEVELKALHVLFFRFQRLCNQRILREDLASLRRPHWLRRPALFCLLELCLHLELALDRRVS